MKYCTFDDVAFQTKVNEALKSVNRVLDIDRNPKLGREVDHEYQNKYDLADQLTNTAIIALINAFRLLGLDNKVLKSIDKNKPTSLRFEAHDSCTFVEERTVDVQSSGQIETKEDVFGLYGNSTKTSVTKVIKKVKEYHWKVELGWELYLYSGTNTDDKTIIANRSASTILITQPKNGKDEVPLPKYTSHEPIELSMNWILQQINMERACVQFHIHRPSAKTPRRNDEISGATKFISTLDEWCLQIQEFFLGYVEGNVLSEHNPANPPTSSINNFEQFEDIIQFCPILPLMEDKTNLKNDVTNNSATPTTNNNMLSFDKPSSSSQSQDDNDIHDKINKEPPLLSNNDMVKLLNEQVRTLEEASNSLTNMLPPPNAAELESTAEGSVMLVMNHMNDLVSAYNDSLTYIESMLYHQLVAAIGKEVQSKDLDQFVKYHNAKLLHPPPQSLCRSIRRPNHYPDGLLSIERQGVQDEPIDTMVQPVESSDPIKMSLNSATTVELTGDKYLHGWLQHRFGSDYGSRNSFQISARARQFSSFILVIGTMIGPNELEPKDAIIVQNKDELLIPLLLEELPTAKEFKDAIQSLSPEQQRFAKEFRSMQLESSVFGMCVIQIKPQLESLLYLPSDSLTKEMKLTQDLMELFIEYQVPSDLLSYDGDDNMDTFGKVERVKSHVSAVMGVIEESKEKQLEEERKKADMAYDMTYAAPPVYASPSLPLSSTQQFSASSRGTVRVSSFARSHFAPAVAAPPPPGSFSSPPIDQGIPMFKKNSAPLTAAEREAIAARRSKNSPFHSKSKSAPKRDVIQFDPKVFVKEGTSSNDGGSYDVTSVPKLLDSTLEKYDTDGSVRSTIIKIKSEWKRTRQQNLLTKPKQSILSKDDLQRERNKAFDLLDALSRSGSLPIDCSELHVVVAVTHCFDKNVIGTIIEDNVNPIEKLEKSALLVASTIYGIPILALVHDANTRERLSDVFPALFDDENVRAEN